MNINDPILRAGADVSNVSAASLDGLDVAKKPNSFVNVLKGVGSVAAGFIPGIGGMLSGVLSGGPDMGAMNVMMQQQQKNAMNMLMIQNRVSNQSQEFSSVSNLLKARHDSEMSAVNNFKS